MAHAWLRRATRYERLLWMAALAAVLFIRWPVLKGYYYRAAGVEAPASTIPWRTDLDAALLEARRTGRPVLVDFNASWCPPCIAMKHEVWTDPDVERAVADRFVPVNIDVDRDGATSDRFQVDSIPTILVIDGHGQIVRRAGFLPVSGMLRFVNGD